MKVFTNKNAFAIISLLQIIISHQMRTQMQLKYIKFLFDLLDVYNKLSPSILNFF